MNYPDPLLDNPRSAQRVMGSFWSRTYGGGGQVTELIAAGLESCRQNRWQAADLLRSIGRQTCPRRRCEAWYPVRLVRQQRQTVPAVLLDGSSAFATAAVFDTGQPDSASYPAPARLAYAAAITERPQTGEILLATPNDFVLRNGRIWFRRDPFSDARLAREDTAEIELWLCGAEFDENLPYRQFGYAFDLPLPNTPAGHELLNELLDMHVSGPAEARLLRALGLAAGLPVARTEETVQALSRDRRGQLIITDRAVYRCGPAAVPAVAVGDVVRGGEPLVEDLMLFRFHAGRVPDAVTAFTVPPAWLWPGFRAGLTFDNRDVELQVDTEHSSGYTYVQFDLGGYPDDVRRFFDLLHMRGVAAHEQQVADPCQFQRRTGTLAHLLDRRANRDGEPGPQHLPRTVNPLTLLAGNVLRFQTSLIVLRVTSGSDDAVGLQFVPKILRQLPPALGVICIYELATSAVTIDPPAGGEPDIGVVAEL